MKGRERDMILWIVGRIHGDDWELQGVCESEQLAKTFCHHDEYWSYFIGPVESNKELPIKTESWPGAYFPLDNN
jgi:hypothetical protein